MWTNVYGSGQVCVVNLNQWGKSARGVYAQAFSLLGPVCAWPVIDSSTYFLDDCPSPAPLGSSPYIQRDYGVSVSEFYSDIWWPDMNRLAREHGLCYTGAMVETYDAKVDGEFQTPQSTYDFQYYGGLLLGQGGELALHGYNHQPLVSDASQYQSYDQYAVWASRKAMEDSVLELQRFAAEEYRGTEPVVYVPPSNILGAEGREVLADNGRIRAVASIYVDGGNALSQEFTVAPDGLVDTPRITSGEFTDDDAQFLAFSELNMHCVNTRFVHPDDTLDESRGADKGWAAMRDALSDYMTWVDQTAPDIRRLTGSGLAGAVQRFAQVTPQVAQSGQDVTIRLDGFVDEAYLFVRLNQGAPGKVTGGDLTQLEGGLYLLHATSDTVTIREATA